MEVGAEDSLKCLMKVLHREGIKKNRLKKNAFMAFIIIFQNVEHCHGWIYSNVSHPPPEVRHSTM